jgi:hypothetical protein
VKIKLDENFPARLVAALGSLSHDVDTVPSERLAGRDDTSVWSASQRAGRFLITQDLDFSDIRRYTPGTHHGLLLIRLMRPGRTALFERVHGLFKSERVEDWAKCLVVATDRKVRVKRSSTTIARQLHRASRQRRSPPKLVGARGFEPAFAYGFGVAGPSTPRSRTEWCSG